MQTAVVVDSNPITRKLIMMTLGDKQYRYVEADSADSAINLILKELPAIVIISQDLGGKSGIDVAKTIKKIYGLANIPFILLFDDPKPKDSDIYEAGIDGTVPKKLLTRFLKDEIKKILSREQVQRHPEWIGTVTTPAEMNEAKAQPQGASRTSTSFTRDSNSLSSLYRRTDVSKLPNDVLVEEVKPAALNHNTFIKTDQYYPKDLNKNISPKMNDYFDPVTAFMRDEVEIIYPYRQESSSTQKDRQKALSKDGENYESSKYQPKTSSSDSLSETHISIAVREAILEVIKEVVPIFKEKLVAALEKKLKPK